MARTVDSDFAPPSLQRGHSLVSFWTEAQTSLSVTEVSMAQSDGEREVHQMAQA